MAIKIQTFDDWLQDFFLEKTDEGKMSLDDDIPDNYEAWLERQDIQDIMDLSEHFAKIMYIQGARDYIQEQLNKLNGIK